MLRCAAVAAGHHAANLALALVLGHGNPARLLALDLGSLLGRVLHIGGLRRRCFSHVNGPAPDNRAAGSKCREFHQCHPYRHSLCSLCQWSVVQAAQCCQFAPVGTKGIMNGKATIGLTVFWQARSGKSAFSMQCQADVSHYGTEPRRFAKEVKALRLLCARIARIEQRGLAAVWGGDSKVTPGPVVKAAPARSARDQAQLDQVRLDHFFHRIARFG
jgi:hypothetical protein